MAAPRKYIYFVLTTPQLELALAVLKSHVARLTAQREKVAGTEAAVILEEVLNKSNQVLDLMLHSVALGRARTKILVTESQFNLVCQSVNQTKRRMEARLLREGGLDEAKHAFLDHLERLEATLGNANHQPTRFDISGADAFKDTELGVRFGPLTHVSLA